ncbi:type II toxin-antitoxin system HicA family toxin [Nostoc sp.]
MRQRGSHIILRRDEPFGKVVVPNHQELDKGTLRAIIRQVGLSVDEFTALPAIMQYSFSPCPLLSKLSDLRMYLIAVGSAVSS